LQIWRRPNANFGDAVAITAIYETSRHVLASLAPQHREIRCSVSSLCYSARAFGAAYGLCYSARAFGAAYGLCYSARAFGAAYGLCYSARAFGAAYGFVGLWPLRRSIW